MKFLAGVSLATAASAAVIDVAKRDASPLSVTLEKVGNSQVKAVVTNSGNEDLKVFKTGTFLDEAAVEKVEVFQGSKYALLSLPVAVLPHTHPWTPPTTHLLPPPFLYSGYFIPSPLFRDTIYCLEQTPLTFTFSREGPVRWSPRATRHE